jgi:hypothetical protein
VFESLFVRTIAKCVEAGLVDGKKLHVDSSMGRRTTSSHVSG